MKRFLRRTARKIAVGANGLHVEGRRDERGGR